jgi:hypothetical protein
MRADPKMDSRGLPTLAGLVSLAAVAATTRDSAATSPSPVIEHVYVNDNKTSGVNTIGALDRHADGTLTPMPGSPFVAGGLGSPATTLSQGALQLSSDGRYLLAVDRGSNQISVLRFKPDGSLELVGDGPVCSNGVNPVSIAVYGGLVYVANAGTPASSGQTNDTGFTLDQSGQLRPLASSTVTLPDGTRLTDVFFSPDGSKLVGTRVSASLIDSFTVCADGLLTAAPGSPFAAQGVGPFGSEFRPTNPEHPTSPTHSAEKTQAQSVPSPITPMAASPSCRTRRRPVRPGPNPSASSSPSRL